MKNKKSIKVKAAFLLMVFALNTVVGFACSVGVDMGFNSKHHNDEEATEALVHVHHDGIEHVHHEKKDGHDNSKGYEEASIKHNSGNDNGNCCNDKVKSFQQIDKTPPNFANIIHPVFFTAFLASYYNINILSHSDIVKDTRPFIRSCHPPIPDIRIAIQSFQI